MESGAPGLVYACVTHVPLWLAPPAWVTPIFLGDAQAPGKLNLRELASEWQPYHPVLGGTAGSFALRRYLLERRPDATRVGICQYRKFVSRERISRVRDPKYRAMDVVPLAALAGDAYARHLDPGDRRFLVSAPRRFTRVFWYRRGTLKEYARDHHVEDLLRFAAEAVAQGVLGNREVERFFAEDVIVPGGIELGVYPADFWLESIGKIEAVVRACVRRYLGEREGYQKRVWSFCAERLGSWLLLERLRGEAGTGWPRLLGAGSESAWARRFAGQLNLVALGGEHRGYVGGT
ncbi:MAG: hypothetical protein ACXWUL_06145 [Caldimonas sp.]